MNQQVISTTDSHYSQKTKSRDNWLKDQEIDLDDNNFENLYEAFNADIYLDSTNFVAWIDKPTLITTINALPQNQRYWSFPGSQRFFWNCKLHSSKKPADLISYINGL